MVEVTLRKADQLEKQAKDAAQKIGFSTTLKISVFEKRPVEALIDAGREKVRKSVAEALALIEAAYTIRALSSEQFQSTGINKLLLERALIETREREIAKYANAETFEAGLNTYEALEEKVKSARARLDTITRSYGLGETETVTVNVLTEKDSAEFKDMLVTLRNRKTAVNDELMQKNWAGRINIPSSVVEILTRNKITVS